MLLCRCDRWSPGHQWGLLFGLPELINGPSVRCACNPVAASSPGG
ncbi:hypothetical protein SynMITS9220_00499 [Synechococcus sp. MIT S9220]|nr:hypothetical protein SynMITS9220_00499 [Synechococcus sp. MIT S9220]